MSSKQPKKPSRAAAAEPDPAGRILEALRAAGGPGLTKAALIGSPARRGLSPALARLVKEHAVVNLGTAKTPRFVLPEHDRRLAEARAAIEKMATPGQAVAHTKSALRAGRRGAAAKIADEAMAQLVAERRLLAVRAGRSTLYLHAASVAPLLAAVPTPTTPAAANFSPDAIRAAYAELSRERGLADVPIAELQRRSGVPLPELQSWLREESRAGRAVPSRGDWALVGEPERAAAIEIRGEPHLRVRLVGGVD